jgi:tetratricopeptide (TPR) repeat protein
LLAGALAAVVLAAANAGVLLAAPSAHASDFWDAVRNPGSGSMRVHIEAAAQALAANQAAVALREAELALGACARCAGARVLRGRALAVLGRHGEALAELEQALARDPAALDAEQDALAAAASALHVDRADLALRVLHHLLGRSSDPAIRARAMGMLGDALQAQGAAGLTRAISAYRDAGADADADPGVRIGLALALLRQGEEEPAFALARRSDGQETERATFARALPPAEFAARIAVLRMALGDEVAADRAWHNAAEGGGPWVEHARAALAARNTRGARKPAAPRGAP